MEEANAKDVWRAALGELELQVTKPYFETYLRGTSGLSLEGEIFAVAAPNSLCHGMAPSEDEAPGGGDAVGIVGKVGGCGIHGVEPARYQAGNLYSRDVRGR